MIDISTNVNGTYTYIICALKCVPKINTTSMVLAPLIPKVTASTTTPTASGMFQKAGATALSCSNCPSSTSMGIKDDLLNVLNMVSTPTAVISCCCWVLCSEILSNTST